MAATLLFVYGTLRQGSDHPRARWLRGLASFAGDARVAGRLYDLGEYPGLGPAEEADDWVVGDLYDLGPSAAVILTELDAYEGPDYQRRQTTATTTAGRAVRAWTYWYRGPARAEWRIVSGIWPPATGPRRQPGLPTGEH